MTWYGWQTNIDFFLGVVFVAFWLNRLGSPYGNQYRHCWRSAEKEEGSSFTPFEAVQIIFTAGLVVVGLLQYFVYDRQATIMEKQASIARDQVNISLDQEKPQVYFAAESVPFFTNGEAAVINDGNSVATNVHIGVTVHPHPVGIVSVLPRDVRLCSENPSMDRTSYIVRHGHRTNVPINIPQGSALKDAVRARTDPILIGCISYRWGFDPKSVHHTWFSVTSTLYNQATGMPITTESAYNLIFYVQQQNLDVNQLVLRLKNGAQIAYFDEDQEQSR